MTENDASFDVSLTAKRLNLDQIKDLLGLMSDYALRHQIGGFSISAYMQAFEAANPSLELKGRTFNPKRVVWLQDEEGERRAGIDLPLLTSFAREWTGGHFFARRFWQSLLHQSKVGHKADLVSSFLFHDSVERPYIKAERAEELYQELATERIDLTHVSDHTVSAFGAYCDDLYVPIRPSVES